MIKKNSDVDTVAVAEEVAQTLRRHGLRVKVDDRDIRSGQKYYDWEIKGVPLRLDIGPRDIAQGTAFAARRTGGKEPLPLDNITEACLNVLDEISDELRKRSQAHMSDVIQPLPPIRLVDDAYVLEGEVKDGHIYELPFDGTDAHAETIERLTGFAFLGDSTDDYDEARPCHMSGTPTIRRVLLAKTY
jgi:prolyl-tRNA synthetase